MRIKTLLPLLALLLLTACGGTPPATGDQAADSGEEAIVQPMGSEPGEWISLFNGKDLSGWHKYGAEGIGPAWKVDDGAIYLDVSDKDGWQTNNGGDIITDEAYSNYELELEWKIGKCGNSGIIYNIQETAEYQYPWQTGPEMQVLDNTCHPDAKITTHRAGDLYDLISVAEENVLPAGEWNKVKLVVTDGQVEHWLNGKKQVEYANTGPEWKAMIAKSKFKDMVNWGMFTSGKISLQDHGDPVWYRNIRLRNLSK
ncbi:MAG: DUF1080 domain-containing protein [Bacteroidota bacterium]